MPRVTRSSYKAEVAQKAVAGPKKTIRITHPRQLATYLELARVNTRFRKEVKEFFVSFKPFVSYPTASLRNALSLTWGIHDLTLHLPHRTPSSLFKGLTFPNLMFFDTNIPHGLLVDFLSAHPSISHLQLGFCGRRTQCPLSQVDLDGVYTLACRTSCVSSVLGSRVDHLNLAIGDASLLPSLTLFGISARPNLTEVITEVFPGDVDFLPVLSALAPRLRLLKMIEVSAPSGDHVATQPMWMDLDMWSSNLKGFPFLNSLRLNTWRRLVGDPRSLMQERRIVEGWATGNEALSPSEGGHSTLTSIMLWYSAGADGQGVEREVLSRWRKQYHHGGWSRESTITGRCGSLYF